MFAPIVLSAQAGVRSVSQERVNAALSLGATRFQLLREIVLPSALPEILTGIRISLGVGWGTLVAAELIAATRGIGYLIMSASQFLATDVVFVGIGIIAPSHSPSPCAFSKPGSCPGKGRTEERRHESSRNNRKDESE
jgi:taurine transport system permease protein